MCTCLIFSAFCLFRISSNSVAAWPAPLSFSLFFKNIFHILSCLPLGLDWVHPSPHCLPQTRILPWHIGVSISHWRLPVFTLRSFLMMILPHSSFEFVILLLVIMQYTIILGAHSTWHLNNNEMLSSCLTHSCLCLTGSCVEAARERSTCLWGYQQLLHWALKPAHNWTCGCEFENEAFPPIYSLFPFREPPPSNKTMLLCGYFRSCRRIVNCRKGKYICPHFVVPWNPCNEL